MRSRTGWLGRAGMLAVLLSFAGGEGAARADGAAAAGQSPMSDADRHLRAALLSLKQHMNVPALPSPACGPGMLRPYPLRADGGPTPPTAACTTRVAAATAYQQGCTASSLLDCLNLGWAYQRGLGVTRDPARAATLYSQACQGGMSGGCDRLAFLYARASGVGRDVPRAMALDLQACKAGSARACLDGAALSQEIQNGSMTLGLMGAFVGMAGVADPNLPFLLGQAADLLKKACTGGDGNSCAELGVLFEKGWPIQDNIAAATFYKLACNRGYASGCSHLANAFETDSLAEDLPFARELLTKACLGGGGDGCTTLGMMYNFADGVPQDFFQAALWYEKGCAAGDGEGCLHLGTLYSAGHGVDANMPRAIALETWSCELGSVFACRIPGLQGPSSFGETSTGSSPLDSGLSAPPAVNGFSAAALHFPSTAQDPDPQLQNTKRALLVVQLQALLVSARALAAQAQTPCPPGQQRFAALSRDPSGPSSSACTQVSSAGALYSHACEGGDPQGCLRLALLYEDGQLSSGKDDVRAAGLFKQGCDHHNADACDHLALNYLMGRGVPRDAAHAAAIYKDSCQAGGTSSCSNLGQITALGVGVAQNLKRANELFDGACKAGYATGCNNLGAAYFKGYPSEIENAVVLFKKACDAGDESGCNNLGAAYSNGQGVPTDVGKGAEFYQKACNTGSAIACAYLGDVYHFASDFAFVSADLATTHDFQARALELFKQACRGDWGASHPTICAGVFNHGVLPFSMSE